MHWFGSFIVGGRAVILKGVAPEWILEAISEEKGTLIFLLVPWANDILLKIDSGEIKLEGLRHQTVEAHAHRCSTGASIPGQALERALSRDVV